MHLSIAEITEPPHHDVAARPSPRGSLGPSAQSPARLMEIEKLSIAFDSDRGFVPAVRSAELWLEEGEILGIVGESGSGKSVTCQALLGLLPPSAEITGRLQLMGQAVSLGDKAAFEKMRGDSISMIFQDPMSALDPLMTARQHLLQRLRRYQPGPNIEALAQDLLRQAGVVDAERVLETYPHQLSGGLCQRVAIAMALAGAPRILIADEATTALDVTVQAEVLDLLADLRHSRSLSVILVSHDLGVVGQICDRVAVMYAGQIVEVGETAHVLSNPQHPYTAGLLGSRPALTGPRRALSPIPGSPPRPGEAATGCAFRRRCGYADDLCENSPDLQLTQPERRNEPRRMPGAVRCHHPLTHIHAAS